MIKPIAYIKTPFDKKFGIPRQSGRAENLKGVIEFLPEYSNPDAFKKIETFTHLWIIFDFSKSHKNGFTPMVRPPRLGGNEKVGVFASRSPFRPNSIGLSSVKYENLEFKGGRAYLTVSGVDLLNGTPVYDVKPYVKFSDSHPDAVCGYADEHENDKLNVEFSGDTFTMIESDLRDALIECLSDDPRPSYIEDGDRVYRMKYYAYDVAFKVKNKTLTVIEVNIAVK